MEMPDPLDMHDGARASTERRGAVSTMKTTGAVSTTQKHAYAAEPGLANTSADSHLTNNTLQDRIRSLEQDKRKLEQDTHQLKRELAKVRRPIDAQVRDVIRQLADVRAQQAATHRDSEILSRERQTWDEYVAIIQADAGMVDDRTAELVAFLLGEDETVKQTVNKEMAKLNGLRKIVDSFYDTLKTYDEKFTAECRRKLPAAHGQASQVKYALDDPLIKEMLEEEYLAGFHSLAMAYELRKARQHKIEVDKSRIAHLVDMKHPQHPHQIGERAMRKFGWRLLCREQNRPEWDDSLNPREWTSLEQIWNVVPETPKGTFFDGIHKGWAKVKEAFQQKLDEEYEAQQFEQIPRKEKRPAHATDDSDAKPARHNKKPMARASGARVRCEYCKHVGHEQLVCLFKDIDEHFSLEQLRPARYPRANHEALKKEYNSIKYHDRVMAQKRRKENRGQRAAKSAKPAAKSAKAMGKEPAAAHEHASIAVQPPANEADNVSVRKSVEIPARSPSPDPLSESEEYGYYESDADEDAEYYEYDRSDDDGPSSMYYGRDRLHGQPRYRDAYDSEVYISDRERRRYGGGQW